MRRFSLILTALILHACADSGPSSAAPEPTPPTSPPPAYDSSTDETVEGRDEDGNGIRDDIDDYIFETFTDPIEKAYVEAFALNFNQGLIHNDNGEEVERLYNLRIKNTVCAVSSGVTDAQYMDDIIVRTVNTEIRAQAYFRKAQGVAGFSTRIPEREEIEEHCLNIEG